ncbi:uncharacterized protein V6R79_012384 [Siganus canaliculatus]
MRPAFRIQSVSSLSADPEMTVWIFMQVSCISTAVFASWTGARLHQRALFCRRR